MDKYSCSLPARHPELMSPHEFCRYSGSSLRGREAFGRGNPVFRLLESILCLSVNQQFILWLINTMALFTLVSPVISLNVFISINMLKCLVLQIDTNVTVLYITNSLMT